MQVQVRNVQNAAFPDFPDQVYHREKKKSRRTQRNKKKGKKKGAGPRLQSSTIGEQRRHQKGKKKEKNSSAQYARIASYERQRGKREAW